MRQDSLEDHDPLNCNTFGAWKWRSRVKLVKLRRFHRLWKLFAKKSKGTIEAPAGFFRNKVGETDLVVFPEGAI